jgi:hypothetical protein
MKAIIHEMLHQVPVNNVQFRGNTLFGAVVCDGKTKAIVTQEKKLKYVCGQVHLICKRKGNTSVKTHYGKYYKQMDI